MGVQTLAPPSMARLIERSHALETPFLLIDLQQVRDNLRRLRAALPGAEVYYAVKANPHPAVVQVLAEEGCGFEISSHGELDLVEALDTRPALVSSNPIKPMSFIQRAAEVGLEAFAIDSPDEVAKMARIAPGAAVYVRLLVDNSGSEWPLARKYGVDAKRAVDLLVHAADLGLQPRGTTFHVGSQCRVAQSWDDALAVTAMVWEAAARRGIQLDLLNIGGGFPVRHTRPIPEVEEIGEVVRRGIDQRFPSDVQVALEPGRMLVGDAAILGASVIGKARRGAEDWVYLDVGVFNGLMETIEGFSYEFLTPVGGGLSNVVLAGPSCDSVDVISDAVALPDLAIGDRLYVANAGAYTLSYASHFNGWPPPAVHVVE